MKPTDIFFHFPKFTDKPNFYKELMVLLNRDLSAPFKVQINGTPVGLEYLKKFGGIQK